MGLGVPILTPMITVYPYGKLGNADHGWLQSKFHFSFADYQNVERMNFGELRVINDDRIAPGRGFGMHPHKNMEIITFVREGSITHQDNLGNKGVTEAGDVQVISAGKGVTHSEMNMGKIDCVLFQIWIFPNRENGEPRWEARKFPKQAEKGSLPVLVSGRAEDAGKNALMIYQDAAIYGGKIMAHETVEQPIKHQAYIVLSKGEILVDGLPMKQGDGAEITGIKRVSIVAKSDTELLVIDVL